MGLEHTHKKLTGHKKMLIFTWKYKGKSDNAVQKGNDTKGGGGGRSRPKSKVYITIALGESVSCEVRAVFRSVFFTPSKPADIFISLAKRNEKWI